MKNWKPFQGGAVEEGLLEESDIRGGNAERRLMALAWKLAGEFEILSVRKTDEWLDIIGHTDVIIAFLRENDAQVIRVPVQVKSSFKYKQSFLRKHPAFRGIVIRVNGNRTDEEILEELRCKLKSIIRHRIGFEDFYAKVAWKKRISSKSNVEDEDFADEMLPREKHPVPYNRGGAGTSRWRENTLERDVLEKE